MAHGVEAAVDGVEIHLERGHGRRFGGHDAVSERERGEKVGDAGGEVAVTTEYVERNVEYERERESVERVGEHGRGSAHEREEFERTGVTVVLDSVDVAWGY